MRVIDAVRGPRLSQHPRAQVRLAPQVGPDELHRHDAVDEHVTRSVNDAHTPFADPRFQAIPAGDDAPEHGIRRLGRLRNSLCHSAPLPLPLSPRPYGLSAKMVSAGKARGERSKRDVQNG